MEKNPIFQDGDLIYNGVIHREVPEIDAYYASIGSGVAGSMNAAGAGSADLRPVFMCGGRFGRGVPGARTRRRAPT